MKQLISRRSFLKAAGVTAAAASMAIGAPAASACWYGDKSDVTILYTNDVHTYIDKQSPKLTYAAIADLKQSYQNAGKEVLLVDAGDHVQGTAYGSMDEGASIIKLMNAAGYDVATPGNHEFDYGMDRAKAIMKEADFPYLSCNWVDLRTTLRVLPSVKVFVRGGRRIAFVGVTTPETFTKSTPAYFMDKAQRKYIYDIQGGEDGKKLYDAVQKAIDKAKLLADVVIGLGHLGVDPSSSPWTSEEVIAHTSGFDAFIDGHSHTVMENKQVQDASGKAVTLTQTGSYFANVGEMTIAADGTITTKLIPTHEGMDAGIAAMQTGWVNTVDDMLGEKIAVGDSDFYVSDPATGKRYTLEEVYQSKNVILSNGSDQRCNFTGDKDPEVLKWQHEMAERAPFNAEMQAYADKVKASLDVPENMDLIGIAMRGSDLNKRFYGHAVQLTADEAVPLLQDRLQCWKKSGRELGVFVKSEEQTALDLIASKFDNVFYSDSVRFKLGESDHVNRSSDLTDKSSKYENTQQYLGDIYLLSQCDCIISTMNNGYYTAIIWNGGKFSHLETIDKGRYK